MSSKQGNNFFLAIVGLIWTTALGPMWAQQELPLDENYCIQPGDVLLVQVLGEEKLGGNLTVGPGGTIALPGIGSVAVAGKTLGEAQKLITQQYKKFLRYPHITVALDESASRRRVYITGAVEKPGSHFLPWGATLLDALSAAGCQEEADLAQITLRRANGEIIACDVKSWAAPAANPLLHADDRIYVPKQQAFVTVLGQVAKPGIYPLPAGRALTLVELLAQLAGGLTEQAARRALLFPAGAQQPEEIDLKRLLEQGEASLNLTLKSGDLILIPHAGRITIGGEVTRPLSLSPASGSLTILEAIVQAGGFTAQADLRRAQLRRGAEFITLNLELLWRQGEMKDNLALQADDILIIPRAHSAEILITGAVSKPGVVDVTGQEPPSLLQALAQAGETPNSDLTRVSIYRNDEHIVCNARQMLEQALLASNLRLQPGDVVYVPPLGKVVLMGGFVRPGLVDYDPQLNLTQYLARGGLPAPDVAFLERGLIIRTRAEGTYEIFPFNAAKIAQGKLPENIPLQPGDIIFLPPKKLRSPNMWAQIRDVLFTAGVLGNLMD